MVARFIDAMIATKGKVDRDLLRELIERVADAVHPVRIVLFGSAAREAMAADSDIDLLVIVPDGTARRDAMRVIYRRLFGFPHATDVVVVTEQDVREFGSSSGLVIQHALREGREVYHAS
jgi:uncharacterized protein